MEAPTIRLPREKYSSFAFDLLCLEDAITTRARTFAMTFNPAHSRIATPMNQPHAQAATSSSAVGRAPSYSPEDLAGFRDFANVMRDAIGGKGMKGSVKELKPSEAAARGCLGTLKSLHRRGLVTFNENLCEAAVLGGQIKVLKWLRENSCTWHAATPVGCGHLQARDAARGGHLDILKWAHGNGCPWDKNASTEAARHGHLEVLQWLRANGCPWTLSMCMSVAEEGEHLETATWVSENACWNGKRTDESAAEGTNMCAWAAQHGNLEMLQSLHANGCPWDERTCEAAAAGGHLELLQWARANGCPWDESTCSSVAYKGHLEVLQWLRANGCPWDTSTCHWAAANGHFDMLSWAFANGAPH